MFSQANGSRLSPDQTLARALIKPLSAPRNDAGGRTLSEPSAAPDKMDEMPRFLTAQPDTRLITLPWDTPLEDWPAENLVALPRGISRHVVRFVKVGHKVYACKEVLEHLALHEYRLLRDLTRLGHAVGRRRRGRHQPARPAAASRSIRC